MTTTAPTREPQVIADPHGLLESGELLATVPELSERLGWSTRALRDLLGGPLYKIVRFVRYTPGPWRYSVADALTAVEPYRIEIEERRRRAAELEASNRAAKSVRLAAAEAAQSARKAKQARRSSRKPSETPAPKHAIPSTRAGGPEVVIVRRAPSRSE